MLRKMFDSKERLTVMCLAALAVVLGIVAIFALGWDNPYFTDSPDYIAAARSLLSDGSYPMTSSFPLFRPPLYPVFIASVWSVTQGSVFILKLVQVALHAGVVLMVYAASKLIFRDRFAAVIGALLAAVNPFFLYHAAAIQSETLHTFLVTLGILAAVALALNEGPEMRIAVVSGVAFGLAALCKPTAFGVGLVVAATLFVVRVRFPRRLGIPCSGRT